MATLTTQEAKSNWRWYLDQMLKIRPKDDNLMSSYFKEDVKASYGTRFNIHTLTKKIFKNVGIEGPMQLNSFDKGTEKLFIPPHYKEGLVVDGFEAFMTSLEGVSEVNEQVFIDAMQDMADNMSSLLDTMARTEEWMCSQAVLYGLLDLTDANGNDYIIDYQRKAASKKAYGAGYDFGIDTVDPSATFVEAVQFQIKEGNLNPGQVWDVFLGNDAYLKYEANPFTQKKADIINYNNISLATGKRTMKGATPHGSVKYGNYTFNIWGYDGWYEDESGDQQYFLPTDTMLVLPSTTSHRMFYGGVPAWKGSPYSDNPTVGVKKGKRVFMKMVDVEGVKVKHGFGTRPLAVIREVNAAFTSVVTDALQP